MDDPDLAEIRAKRMAQLRGEKGGGGGGVSVFRSISSTIFCIFAHTTPKSKIFS
jgi:hypothetical protein